VVHTVDDFSTAAPASAAAAARAEVLIAVWDGLPARGLGGTADVVAYAKQCGRPVEVI
jgi:hypothetical protein